MAKYVIVAIIIALVLQNTCPQGWAAKTAFVSCGTAQQASQCPMHKQKGPKRDGKDDVTRGISNVQQAFVIHMTEPDNSYQILEHQNGSLHMDSCIPAEIFSDPIYRPPILAPLA